MGIVTDEPQTFAQRYQRWWAPVLAASALRLLELVEEAGSAPNRVGVDVGTGTGTLASAAMARWPQATVVGVDPDPGMLAVASDEDSRRRGSGRSALFLAGRAEALPFRNASVDVVVSSFVFQYVDRATALREAVRVLRPGGVIAFVAWQESKRLAYPASDVFTRTLVEFGLQPSEPVKGKVEGLGSAAAVAGELRQADLLPAWTDIEPIGYRFTPTTFLEWKVRFDDRELFETLDHPRKERLIARLERSLARLQPGDFVIPDPVVFAVGRRRP